MAAMLGPDGLAAVKDVTKLGAPQTSTYREMARAVRVDDVVRAGTEVCVLKADIEGYEAHALGGAPLEIDVTLRCWERRALRQGAAARAVAAQVQRPAVRSGEVRVAMGDGADVVRGAEYRVMSGEAPSGEPAPRPGSPFQATTCSAVLTAAVLSWFR